MMLIISHSVAHVLWIMEGAMALRLRDRDDTEWEKSHDWMSTDNVKRVCS